eukprot:TRINITY_DN13751_c0_g1_i1.p1 TRINITY_DN13751_c0_g1~~TRINITY_DN13751_c0_g1_i1.p1  ORF type:complete len:890 (+),score=228.37 TRINITY_DN13751_c0_g1_i1:55-2724(+)
MSEDHESSAQLCDQADLTKLIAWWCVTMFGVLIPLMFHSNMTLGKVLIGQGSCVPLVGLLACILCKSKQSANLACFCVLQHAYLTGLVGVFLFGGIHASGFITIVGIATVIFMQMLGTILSWAAIFITLATIISTSVLDSHLPRKDLPLWAHAVLSCGSLLLYVGFHRFFMNMTIVHPFTPRDSIQEIESDPSPVNCSTNKGDNTCDIVRKIVSEASLGASMKSMPNCEATTVLGIDRNHHSVCVTEDRDPMSIGLVSVSIPPAIKASSARASDTDKDSRETSDLESRSILSPRGAFGRQIRDRKPEIQKSIKSETIDSPCSCMSPWSKFCPETGESHRKSPLGGIERTTSERTASAFGELTASERTGSERTIENPRSPVEVTFKDVPKDQPPRLRSRVRANSFTTNINKPSAVKIIKKTFNWKKGDLIGQGGFGTVHIGLNLETGELMAVKNVSFQPNDKNVVAKMKQLQREIEIMKPLDHTHVVRYFFTERMGNSINIFMEYVPGGSIQKLLKTFGPLSETTVVQYTYQILLGLAHLHAQGIIHRDIKGANVLLTVEGMVKVADFGASAIVETKDLMTGVQGTPYWMAPEVISAQGHNWEADIWSLGCTVMEMLTGKNPWHHLGLTQVEVLQWIVGDMAYDPPISVPAFITQASRMFLMDCLRRRPEQRPSARQLIEHHYFTEDAEEASHPLIPEGNDSVLCPTEGSPQLPTREYDKERTNSMSQCASPKGKFGKIIMEHSARNSVVSVGSNANPAIQSYIDSEAGQWPNLFSKRPSNSSESHEVAQRRSSPFKMVRLSESNARNTDELEGEVVMSEVEIPSIQPPVSIQPPDASTGSTGTPSQPRRKSSSEWVDMVKRDDTKLRSSLRTVIDPTHKDNSVQRASIT